MPDGEYRLGTLTATKRGGAIRLSDGTLAGSVLTMDEAFRNLVSIGLPLAEASRRLSTIPADWLGMTEVGRIEAGALADFAVFGGALEVQQVRVGGRARGE
jgi:N-acetylglucosamine-6-phosphate deacetylase